MKMGIVSGKDLLSSLAKAKKIGIVEDSFELGGLEITLRNLLPSEYTAIQNECSELEGMDYVDVFQKGHLSRAIQELDGVSLREVDFIEDESPNPKKPGQTHAIKRERHVWVKTNIIDTWGKEAIDVAFRKLTDLITKADTKAKGNIEFLTPDETAEEQYRRLISEAKTIQGELPPAILVKILHENGLDFYTEEETREALSKLDKFTEETQATQEEEAPKVEPPTPAPAPPAPPQGRVPMNAMEEAEPLPPVAPLQRVLTTPAPTQPVEQVSERAKNFLANELEFDPSLQQELANTDNTPVVLTSPLVPNMPVLEKSEYDPRVANSTIDRPPPIGLNPKFRRPAGM